MKLDRSMWEGCHICRSEFPIWYLIGCRTDYEPDFCPNCGKPQTEKAWTALEIMALIPPPSDPLTPDELPEELKAREWISVEERMPKDGRLVLLYAFNPYGPNDIFLGYRNRSEFSSGNLGVYEWVAKTPMSSSGYVVDERGNCFIKPRKVTHWMPLPEPPKTATDE